METKEEILKKHFDKKGITNEHIHVAAYLSVLDAMNEYATQQVNLLNKPAVMPSVCNHIYDDFNGFMKCIYCSIDKPEQTEA